MSGLFDREPVPIADQIREVRREISMRRAVYKRQVDSGGMRRSRALYQIRAMQAVLESLEDLRRRQEGRTS